MATSTYYGGWGASADSDTYSDTGSEGGPSPQVPVPEGMAAGVKGSAVYTPGGVGDPRVVLSVKAVRGAAPADLIAVHDQILEANTDEMLTDAVLLAFQSRDIRGGKGERAVFQTLFQNIARHHPLLAENLVDLVPEYGSWRDVFTLAAQTPILKDTIFKVVTDQLRRDEATAVATRVAPSTRETTSHTEPATGISLLAKWAPREGNSQDLLAKALAAHIWAKDPDGRTGSGANASYRKRLAALNRFIQTTEVYECANRWDEIDPKRVPARAREIKMAAYLNEKVQSKEEKYLHEPKVLRKPDDPKRMACREHFQTFFKKAATGEVKISGAETLYPHELVEKMWNSTGHANPDEVNAWNAVWSQMIAKASNGGGLGSSIAMCDFSGSMSGTPYWVSMAMGLLIASVNAGPFKNKFMTFDSNPLWHQIPADATLQTALDSIRTNPGIGQGLSTDFQKAMDLVLQTLYDNQTPPGQEPKNLIVITDMGWDQASKYGGAGYYTGNSYSHHHRTGDWETHLDAIKASFKRGGWEPPRIVIWNVSAAYSNDFHAQADTPGVIMLSGWSPSLFKILCEEGPRCITPYDALRAQLDDKRYDCVRTRVSEWLRGGWRGVA